jgi:hypothetical protein
MAVRRQCGAGHRRLPARISQLGASTPECDSKSAFAQPHLFWPVSVSLADSGLFHRNRIARPGHVTDVYLAGLELRRAARLVSFDANVPWQAVAGATSALIEVPAL